MEKPSVKKRVLAVIVCLYLLMNTIFIIYTNIKYIVPVRVDGQITELSVYPKDTEAADLCDEKYFLSDSFQEEKTESRQTAWYHLAFTAKYNQLDQEHIANYNEDFESRHSRRCVMNLGGVEEKEKVSLVIDRKDKSAIRYVDTISNNMMFLPVPYLYIIILFLVLLWGYKTLFYKDVFLSPIMYVKQKTKPAPAPFQNATIKKSVMSLGYGKSVSSLLIFFFVFSLIGIFFMTCSVLQGIGLIEFVPIEIDGLLLFLCIWGVLFYNFVFFFMVYLFTPLRLSKKEGVVWKSYFRPSKKNIIAKIEDIKGLEFINQHSLFFCRTSANFILKDGQRIHLANFRTANKTVAALKEVAAYLEVPVSTPMSSFEDNTAQKDSNWQTIRRNIGYFEKITERGENLVLDYSLAFKIVFYTLFSLGIAYLYYVFCVYPSDINCLWCAIISLFCLLSFYQFFGVLCPKKFNLVKSFYSHRPIFNLFGFSPISLSKIDFLQLICIHGHKKQLSIIQLNIVYDGEKRINLLTTVSYKKALRLADELAKRINKPLFVDPYLVEK